MNKKTKETKIEQPKITKTRTVRYDRANHNVIMSSNVLVERADGSTTTTKMEDIVSPTAAKDVYSKMQAEKQGYMASIKQLKAQIDTKFKNSDEDLTKMKSILEELQQWDQAKNAVTQLKDAEEMLKSTNKGILELEPTIKKLPK